MPGFMMHLTEGEMILKKMGWASPSYETANRQFMLGAILPDITDDKERTHFRPNHQAHQINKYPDMAYVMHRYEVTDFSPVDLGILAHLQLDAAYVTSFWPRYLEFQKKDHTPSTDTRNELYVKLLRQPKHRIPLSDFFSLDYFYGDYDIINPVLAYEFHPFIPKDVPYAANQIHITECIPASPSMVSDMLQPYVCCRPVSPHTSKLPTKVFPYADIIEFLEQQAEDFVRYLRKNHPSFLM